VLAARAASVSEAAKVLGTTGYVVHSVPFAAYCFMRFGLDPLGCSPDPRTAHGY
jgi:ADP-ribosylglycohydrolase